MLLILLIFSFWNHLFLSSQLLRFCFLVYTFFAHLEFVALNVSMVIFCGRAMTGADNASHRAGPGWIQLTSTGDQTHDMQCAEGEGVVARTQRMLGVCAY